jgi:uncharacterized membrane protein YtjA (UPF0391 family)
MLSWALRFFVAALLTAIVGFSGLSGLAQVGKVLFIIAVALFAVALVAGLRRRRTD